MCRISFVGEGGKLKLVTWYHARLEGPSGQVVYRRQDRHQDPPRRPGIDVRPLRPCRSDSIEWKDNQKCFQPWHEPFLARGCGSVKGQVAQDSSSVSRRESV